MDKREKRRNKLPKLAFDHLTWRRCTFNLSMHWQTADQIDMMVLTYAFSVIEKENSGIEAR